MMKLNRLAFLLLYFFSSCSNPSTNKEAAAEENWFITDTVLLWNCDAAAETKFRIYQPKDSLTFSDPIINGINQVWPEVNLQYISTQHDTLQVQVGNSNWLTGLSGSNGAEQYLTFAALNLLEVKGIRFVRFLFPEGSHAGPGVWSLSDFRDWKTINKP